MEQLKSIKDNLIAQVQGQMGNLQEVNAKELGEVVDMVKDLEEAIYYCTIVEAMKEKDENKSTTNINYYTEPTYYRDIDRNDGRMYYTPGNMGRSNSGNNNSNQNYGMMRDSREGRSPQSRKMYMEGQEMHNDSKKQMLSLETYMHELTDDILEMVKKATPDEKQMLKNKMNTLVQQIV